MGNNTRRQFVVIVATLAAALMTLPTFAASAVASQNLVGNTSDSRAIAYLESIKNKPKKYLAPSQIDQRYNIALYVNAKPNGPNAQRMWVLQRDPLTGEFKLAMWDEKWWNGKRAKRKYNYQKGQTPPFSWLVSTGKRWRGDNRSGPTSLGVFALDERPGRTQKGWHSRGMIHAMYIDLHYNSGRRSGIAFHGTTRSQYRKLGRIASHGCIRMHQTNALNLLNRIKGWDNVLSNKQRWGEVPRFWKYQRNGNRYGYVRDGSLLPRNAQKAGIVATASAVNKIATTLNKTQFVAPVLTKEGFRAVAIIFKD